MSAKDHPLLIPLKTHATSWDPASVKVTLNLVADGCIVPTTTGGARVDYSHLVVLDNFLDEPTRSGLTAFLTAPGWPPSSPHPPDSKWERATADAASRPATWGLRGEVLRAFAQKDVPAKLEVQSRLCKLYPDMLIAHMPSEHIQAGLSSLGPRTAAVDADAIMETGSGSATAANITQPDAAGAATRAATEAERLTEKPPFGPTSTRSQQTPAAVSKTADTDGPGDSENQAGQEVVPDGVSGAAGVDCSCFLANAAVYGDQFSWHVDADPQCFSDASPWTQEYGLYCNREPGKPLFVSLLLYLDADWPRENDAETLFLDSMTETGVFVRPKRYRAVLIDQDMVHRLSTPSATANRPRYSLVWKLVMIPKLPQLDTTRQQHQQKGTAGIKAVASKPATACIARREWGRPTYFGSAAHVERVARQTAGVKAARAAAAADGADAEDGHGGKASDIEGTASGSTVCGLKRQHV